MSIIFLDDWKKFPSARPDFDTPNESFLRYAGLLKKMGVKNHTFCLALHNPELKGVDPRDEENLTYQQKIAIAEECSVNPWYFFREIALVPPQASPDPVPLKANRGNISLFWLFFNHITTLLIQPRQTGKSVSTDILMLYLFMFGSVNTKFNLLTKDNNLRVTNVTRLKDMVSLLPGYLNQRTKSDTNNTEKITINELGNIYNTNVPQSSPKAAYNLGRGMTTAINHIDEFAFINNIKITLPVMLAASSAARDSAAEYGLPYGNIFTTTPGYLKSESGTYAYKFYKDSLRWSEHMFDSDNITGLEDLIMKNNSSGNLQILLEFNHRQLGKTDAWLRRKIAEAKSEGKDAGADFLNKWAEGSEGSPIDKEILKKIRDSSISDPSIEISKFGYITRWYIDHATRESEYFRRKKLVMGLDTSDATGKDDIGMVIRDANTGETIAAGDYNETNLITFSDWVVDWIERFPNLTVIVERRSSGAAILDNMIRILPAKGIDPFERIFNWVVHDHDINEKYRKEVINVPLNRRGINVYEKYRKYFGYATSASGRASRDNLYGTVFMQSTKYTARTVRDKKLINQLSGLTIKNNRIDHKASSHDDLVIAWLLCHWFLSEAKNKEFYGLRSSETLSTMLNAMVDEEGGPELVAKKNRQIKLKETIDQYLDKLKGTKNKMMSNILTNKIKHLYQGIDTTIIQSYNIESLLENIELEKKKSKNKRKIV